MAPDQWKATVAEVLRELADNLGEFSTNDLWERVPAPPAGAKRQDVAGILKRLEREGVIRPTEKHVKSNTGTRNGGLTRVWVATWYAGDAPEALPTTARVRALVAQYADQEGLALADAVEALVKEGLAARGC